jgi:hypothetical protein
MSELLQRLEDTLFVHGEQGGLLKPAIQNTPAARLLHCHLTQGNEHQKPEYTPAWEDSPWLVKLWGMWSMTPAESSAGILRKQEIKWTYLRWLITMAQKQEMKCSSPTWARYTSSSYGQKVALFVHTEQEHSWNWLYTWSMPDSCNETWLKGNEHQRSDAYLHEKTHHGW